MKIGFIGAGKWTRAYAVATRELGLEISGVYAPDETAQQMVAEAGGSVAGSAEEVIAGADCLVIGSPTNTHAEYIAVAAEVGKPVLCGSPVAGTVGDLERISDVAAGKGNLYASFPLRARPEYQRLKSAMASGELGTIGMIRLGICLPRPEGWKADRAQSGGAFLQIGTHLVDWLEWLAGPVVRVHGASPEGTELDYTVLVARMSDGSIAHLEISLAEAEGAGYDYYEVAGSNGLLDFDTRQSPLMVVSRREEGGSRPFDPSATPAYNELKGFVAKISGGSGGFTSLQHGVDVCRKALQIRDSIVASEVLQLAG